MFPLAPPNPNQGIIYSQMQKALLTGVDPYANIPVTAFIGGNSFYHASVEVDASQPWNTSTLTVIGSSEISLYSVMLHEVMHLLAFTSLIDVTGGSKLATSAYSRYDQFLYDYNGNPLLVSSTPNCPNSNVIFNSPTVSLSAISASGICSPPPNPTPHYTNCAAAAQYSSNNTHVKVYTPDCWAAGSSLSHFEDMCSTPTFTPTGPPSCTPTPTTPGFNDLYFVMSNSTSLGTCYVKNYPKQEERCVLADFGYSLNPTNTYTSNVHVAGTSTSYSYGSSCATNTQIIALNDGLNGGVYTFTTMGSSVIIPFISLIANDSPSAAITPTCFESISPTVTYTLGATDLTVTANPGTGVVI